MEPPAPRSPVVRPSPAAVPAQQAYGAQPGAAPPPTDTVSPTSVRREELGRTSLQAIGTRYPGLAASSSVLIRTGALMFWTCLVLGVLVYLAAIVAAMRFDFGLMLGVLAGLVFGGPLVLLGRVLQLSMAVSGELLLVTMDIEDSIRRIASARDE